MDSRGRSFEEGEAPGLLVGWAGAGSSSPGREHVRAPGRAEPHAGPRTCAPASLSAAAIRSRLPSVRNALSLVRLLPPPRPVAHLTPVALRAHLKHFLLRSSAHSSFPYSFLPEMGLSPVFEHL